MNTMENSPIASPMDDLSTRREHCQKYSNKQSTTIDVDDYWKLSGCRLVRPRSLGKSITSQALLGFSRAEFMSRNSHYRMLKIDEELSTLDSITKQSMMAILLGYQPAASLRVMFGLMAQSDIHFYVNTK